MIASEAARRLIDARRPGSIVNIPSILGWRVAGNVLPYTVSKAGLEQLTKALALEWARPGRRVHPLHHGYVETALNRDYFDSDAGQAKLTRIPPPRLGPRPDVQRA